MSIINNKYNLRGQKLNATLYNGYVYDITPSKISDEMINLLYSNNLVTDGLVIDVNPSSQTINYISNPNAVTNGLMNNIISGSTTNYQYIFKNRLSKLYTNPTIDGWTIESVINFDGQSPSSFNPFFYIGVVKVGKENEIISGETIDNSNVDMLDFLSNNLTFSFDQDKSIELKSIKYTNECYDCDEEEITLDEFFNVPKNIESDSMLLDSSLTSGCPEDTIFIDNTEPVSGSTYFVHNFNRSLTVSNTEDFHLTVTFEREKTPNIHNCTELNQKFLDSVSERTGTLKVYINCVLYGVINDFEDIIPRGAEGENSIPYIHSWGYTDDSVLFNRFNLNGEFNGIIKQGRFYTRPLNVTEICNNFTIFKSQYQMFDLKMSDCFINI